jgi:hypothetical protein
MSTDGGDPVMMTTIDDFYVFAEERYLSALAWRGVFYNPKGSLLMYASKPAARSLVENYGVFIGTFAILDAETNSGYQVDVIPCVETGNLAGRKESDIEAWAEQALRWAADDFATKNERELVAEANFRRDAVCE